MSQERAGAATVIAQEGDRVQVDHNGKWLTVPMRGFPDGFKLVPGRLVVLFDEPTGPVARPLVRVVRAVPSGQLGEGGDRPGVLEHEGRRLEMQEGTVFDEPQPGVEARASEDNDVWIVERAGGDPADQVIAVRRSR
jgi:hypothetical protein